ncbi:amidase [Trichoderma gamsii]|uniref:Amidase n=1 Tax=Trichoderma gamsii TaxID=398673 RepID=A0A2P4ZEL1_9HYPO|nr:amidase [Trichoderma gamsii]PON22730.1 amidase [Trichoderma gamsii]
MNNNFNIPAAPYAPPLLLDATLEELRTGLDADHFTSLQLVQAYVRRIQQVNPLLDAVTQINPDAHVTAIQLDNQRDQMRNRSQLSRLGPLHGIPVLIKNTFVIDDNMPTTVSLHGVIGTRVPEDSTVVRKLRGAGAIILGRTRTEWPALRHHSYTNNAKKWTPHGGCTRGAYFEGQVAKGSCGGCAVGASIGLAWASVATDTDGSIIMPASQSNVVGFKPTVGLTSRHLAIPQVLRQDLVDTLRLESVGTMARTVRDAAYLMKAIMGRDGWDPYTTRIPFDIYPNYVAACREDGLRGMRIGFLRSLAWFLQICTYDLSVDKFNQALDMMRKAEATIVDGIMLNGAVNTDSDSAHHRRCALDFSLDSPRHLCHSRKTPSNMYSAMDSRGGTRDKPYGSHACCQTNASKEALERENNKTPTSQVPEHEQGYLDDLGLLTAFKKYELDAVATWPHVAATLCSRMGNICAITVPFSKLGPERPIVASDDGSIDSAPNKPYGISFIGTSFQEEKLFKIAYAFEQLAQARSKVRPIVVPRTELADLLMCRGQ